MQTKKQWYVLTGGPCAGKTTTIHELERRGKPIMHEPARGYIEREMKKGRTLDDIRSPLDVFLDALVVEALAQEDAYKGEEPLFLDRALVDSVAYYDFLKVAQTELLKSSAPNRPYKKIFLLDLVDFENDSARPETAAEAKIIHTHIDDAYRALGYDVVPVPVLPVEKRVDYILERLTIDLVYP